MKFLSLSNTLKLALLFSLSFTSTSSSFSSSFSSNPKSSSSSSSLPFSISSRFLPARTHKATVADLLSLLGPKDQASKVDFNEARDIWSCFKFLVPFDAKLEDDVLVKRRSMISGVGQRRENEENELIWWPPTPVLELARLSVDSGGDPGVIHRALDPTIIPVSFCIVLSFL